MEPKKLPVRLWYGLDEEDLNLEPDIPLNARHVAIQRLSNLEREEAARVICSAAILYEHTAEQVDVWQCLYTAIIWERG